MIKYLKLGVIIWLGTVLGYSFNEFVSLIHWFKLWKQSREQKSVYKLYVIVVSVFWHE